MAANVSEYFGHSVHLSLRYL